MITLPKILCCLIVLLQVKNRSLYKHGVAGMSVNSKAGPPWRSTTLLSQYVIVNMASAKVYLRKKTLVHAFFDTDCGGHISMRTNPRDDMYNVYFLFPWTYNYRPSRNFFVCVFVLLRQTTLRNTIQ